MAKDIKRVKSKEKIVEQLFKQLLNELHSDEEQ